MRINVYAEEITDRVEIVKKQIEGQTFTGIRIYLELPVTIDRDKDGNPINKSGPFEHRKGDDDSAAVTFWGTGDEAQSALQKALDTLKEHLADSG